MSSYLVEQLYHINPPGRHVSQDPWWNQNLLPSINLGRVKWLWNSLENISYWPKPMLVICVYYDGQYTILGHKTVWIMRSLDIYVVDTIPLNTYSQMKLFQLTM